MLEQRTGASTDEIDAIPELKFDLNLNERWGNDINCAVCLDEYVVGDLLKQLDCGHHFHKACIDPWLKKSRICPLCKQTFNQAVNMKKVESVEIQLNNHL